MISSLDTFAMLAWVDTHDPHHVPVAGWFERSVGAIVTTEWILLEFANAMSTPKRRKVAIELLKIVRSDDRFDIIGYRQTSFETGYFLQLPPR